MLMIDGNIQTGIIALDNDVGWILYGMEWEKLSCTSVGQISIKIHLKSI